MIEMCCKAVQQVIRGTIVDVRHTRSTPPRFLRPFRWLRDVTPCVRAGAAFRYSGKSRSLLLVLYESVMGAKYYEMSLRSFLGPK